MERRIVAWIGWLIEDQKIYPPIVIVIGETGMAGSLIVVKSKFSRTFGEAVIPLVLPIAWLGMNDWIAARTGNESRLADCTCPVLARDINCRH